MTDAIDTAAIRARMAALKDYNPGPWEYLESLRPNGDEWFGCSLMDAKGDEFLAYEFDSNGDFEAISPTVRLIAASPDMHAAILALCDALDEARAEIAKLGREVNLARYGQPDFAWPVHVEAMERLRAENDRLRKTLDHYWDQQCEGFCHDLPERGSYDPHMDDACSGCRARAALSPAEGQNEGDA